MPHLATRSKFVLAFLVGLLMTSAASAETRLLRFPDIHQNRVVFSYAGDLWTASAEGGAATRLTAHPGVELFAKFSPDGEWIAFTGQYDGDEQVYVMPSTGGEPRQLTFYPALGPLPPRWGYDHQVYGWAPDSRAVLFRSARDGWDLTDGRLYTVDREGGMPEALPMPVAGSGDLSPDGSQVVYSPLFRDFRSWKRYQGGWAQDLVLYDIASGAVTPVTEHPRTDRDPMWAGDDIYFASDRTGTLNLYRFDGDGAATAVTKSSAEDVRWPSSDGQSQIIYELGGTLHVYDTAAGASRALAIRVPTDGLWTRPSFQPVADYIEAFDLGAGAETAVFAARGDVFTVAVEDGLARNLTRSSNAHEKGVAISPDGKHIAFLSDRDGEEEIYLAATNGRGGIEQLTDGGSEFRYAPFWSPDGERLAFADKSGHLWSLAIDSRELTEVAYDPLGRIQDADWSPDGRHLAFSLQEPSTFSSLWIWSVDGGEPRRVTNERFHEWAPSWSRDGEYLFYLSDREFAPQIGSWEWNYVVDRETYIYALALKAEGKNPFPPRELEDEEEGEEEAEDDAPKAKKQRKKGGDKAAKDDDKQGGDETDGKKLPEVRIDFEGLAQRVARVPVDADNYGGLMAVDGHLLYTRGGSFYYGRRSDVRPELRVFSLEDREEETLAQGIQGYAVDLSANKILLLKNGEYEIREIGKGGDGEAVSTDGLAMQVDPRQEWAQIFDEVWRRYRDFFYVENMHGYDWQTLAERYRPLVAEVGHRADLNYVLSEMIAELNVSHAYVSGGDIDLPERPGVALLGARFELDEASGRYRIARIFSGQNAEDRYRSPLTAIGVNVAEGDYLLTVDGEPLEAPDNPWRLLRHRADRPVELTVAKTADGSRARRVVIDPIAGEDSLLYLAWTEHNRRKVDELSGGRVGYLHIPDMGSNGIREFIKYFYSQIRKEGLVIDVRGNGGGNVSQMLIERLRREVLALGYRRDSAAPSTYPAVVFAGPMAALLNETSASDGDIFPAMFRQAGLGPLIGKRSWGGVVGITGHGPLIDGGGVSVPEFGFASPDGDWIIEGFGVEPDIVVENDPASLLAGRDPQLERGVEEVMKQLDDPSTYRLPQALPEGPDKTP
ncbi:MAG: S41 family peptidase [Acidobacteriota bacterium]